MLEYLISNIEKKVILSDADKSVIQEAFVVKKVRKRDQLLREGDICSDMFFVAQGCLILYKLDDEGREYVTQLATEGWWIGDMYSYFSGLPTEMCLEALEPSVICAVKKDVREKLFSDAPIMERYFRMLLENNFIATHRRVTNLISKSAEQRYADFLKFYPQFAQRFPQKYIASFLGITPETLSRVRVLSAEQTKHTSGNPGTNH